MYKAVLRVEPLKEKDLSKVEKHQNRLNDESHINKDKSLNNKILFGSENLKDDILKISNKYKSHPKASICGEMILTAHHEFFDKYCQGWKEGKINNNLQKWIDTNVSFLKEKYPGLAGIRIHLDEQAPHIHAFIVPVDTYKIKYRRGEKTVTKVKYNNIFGDDAKVIYQARKEKNPELTKLGKLQTEYADYLHEKKIPLLRGTRNSEKRHETIAEYHKLLEKELIPLPIDKILIKQEIGTFGIRLDKDAESKIEYAESLKIKANAYDRIKRENKEMKKETDTLKEKLASFAKEIEEYKLKYETISKEQTELLRKIPLEKIAELLTYDEPLLNDKGKYKWRNAIDMVKDITGYDFKQSIGFLASHFNDTQVKNELIDTFSDNIEEYKKIKLPFTKYQEFIKKECSKQLIGLGGNEGTTFRITCMSKDKPTFNVGKRKDEDEKFYTMNEVIEKIPELSYQNNVNKYNIFITPFSDKYQFYLIDDLSNDTLKNLESDGFVPNILTKSSRDSMQGVFLLDKKIEKDKANHIFRDMNSRYGDPKILGQVHPFRLVGFKNVKEKHLQDGKYPLVEIIRIPIRKICEKFKALVALHTAPKHKIGSYPPEKAKHAVAPDMAVMGHMPLETTNSDDHPAGGLASGGGEEYTKKRYRELSNKYGSEINLSVADFMIVSELEKMGINDDIIMNLIEKYSPDIHNRHKNTNYYLRITLEKAKQEKDNENNSLRMK
mgnify:CR=1 FL=1